jgi:uncharacterized membrane protein YkvA (DUF1232 family)
MRPLLVAAGIVAVLWFAAIVILLLAGRRAAAKELATLLPNLILLFRGLMRDPRVPRASKIWLGFAIAWLVSPIDLVPEFIPVLGPLDDAVIAALVLRHVMRRTTPEVVVDHWRGDPATLDTILRIAG